jgi:MoaA/NifB/PqqE/SkfB family radical SAM enzyme
VLLQLEITTRCNFDCFYCAGRQMRQADMPYDSFATILSHHIATYGLPEMVSLQGEGEPTLHHDFFRMARHIRDLGSRPYTITNGTHKHPDQFIGLFPRIGVSVDSLDESAAEKIGRHNLPRVLGFIEALAPHATIIVHSVAHREHTPPIAEWCRRMRYQHVVQPLQTKPDYPSGLRVRRPTQASAPARFSCSYLKQPRMRYHSLDGTEMPCCFIKDTSVYEGLEGLLRHQQRGTTPKSCLGCRYVQS